MDEIGPFTFNGVRFFVGFLALIPFFFVIEKNKFFNENNKDRKNFLYLSISIGIFI
jgi:EamA-like transporter family.